MPYTVVIEDAASQLIAATRIHTSRQAIGNDIGAGFGRVIAALGAENITPSGAPLVVYYDLIDEETDGDIEVCIPVGQKLSMDSDVYCRELEGGSVATATHRGPYQELSATYQTITAWISEHGHEVAGPPREIYLNDPQTVQPADLITRVEFPIRVQAS